MRIPWDATLVQHSVRRRRRLRGGAHRQPYSSTGEVFREHAADLVATAVVLACSLVLSPPEARGKDRVVADVLVRRASAVEMNGATLRVGDADVAGVHGVGIEQNGGTRGAGKV